MKRLTEKVEITITNPNLYFPISNLQFPIMKYLYSLLFTISFGASLAAQTTVTDYITFGGLDRYYRLYVPAVYNANQSVPLILNLHGYTSNAIQQEFYGDLKPIADTANFLVVHPEGTGPSGQQFWNAWDDPTGPNDVGFLSALIDTLSAHYNIDPERVFSCGMSNGGIMSYYLACHLNNKIAAIASVTGSMTLNNPSTCQATSPVPVLEIHGTADATVPYLGNTTFMPIESVVNYWVAQNNTSTTPTVVNIPDINVTDGCTATEYKYTGGTNGSEVVLVKITGGAHTWPGAPLAIGVTNMDFSASLRIWEFFRKYRKSQLVGVGEVAQSLLESEITPNPAAQIICLTSSLERFDVSIRSVQGTVVFSKRNCVSAENIDIRAFSGGLYFVTFDFGKQQITKKLMVY